MASGSHRPPFQETVTFKDVAVDFTQEEWGLLDHPQKELYKGVMLENARHLLSLGLPVPREDVVSYFEQREAPWMLEQEDLRSRCPEGEIRVEVKTMAELNLSVEETQEQRSMDDGPCDITWREICALHQRSHTGEKPYECDPHGKAFMNRASLAQHQRIHTEEKPYEHDQSEKAFTLRTCLTEHQRIYTGEKPYECNQCGKAFTKKRNLIVHQRIHIGEKPYECNQCGKAFICRNSHIRHQRLHTGEKPHECNECGKAFRDHSHIIKHQRIHIREKPYKCNQCGKTFIGNSRLAKHQRIHSEEKSFKCNRCGKSFGKGYSLAFHKRIHTGEKPYEYNQCGKAFTQRTNLTAHQRIHTREKPYECNQCGKAFRGRSTLTNHQRIHTGEKSQRRCSITRTSLSNTGQWKRPDPTALAKRTGQPVFYELKAQPTSPTPLSSVFAFAFGQETLKAKGSPSERASGHSTGGFRALLRPGGGERAPPWRGGAGPALAGGNSELKGTLEAISRGVCRSPCPGLQDTLRKEASGEREDRSRWDQEFEGSQGMQEVGTRRGSIPGVRHRQRECPESGDGATRHNA
ncbi:zinc finger protein 558-like [Vombatus ursinus]|uniref:zinc finger protein 558-like n=1 Tax=Vombatus ursinus TaxID=29139 RepID=UPI000FFD25E9|nr:zinc finger protein 558-like [Vombatus ursinus]